MEIFPAPIIVPACCPACCPGLLSPLGERETGATGAGVKPRSKPMVAIGRRRLARRLGFTSRKPQRRNGCGYSPSVRCLHARTGQAAPSKYAGPKPACSKGLPLHKFEHVRKIDLTRGVFAPTL